MSEQETSNKVGNTENKEPPEKKTFVERIFHDDLEGEYDDEGFAMEMMAAVMKAAFHARDNGPVYCMID